MQKRGLLLGVRGWTAVLVALLVITVLFPVLNLLVPEGSAFHMSDYAVGLVAAKAARPGSRASPGGPSAPTPEAADGPSLPR